MTHALLIAANSATSNMATYMAPSSPAFPPSFDNNPVLFGITLFARILVSLLSAATIVRLVSRTRVEGLACNHPVFYHRMSFTSLLCAAWLGSTSDVLTYLFWNEVTPTTYGTIMTVSRVFDATTMIPFLMALFVPWWVGLFMQCGWRRPGRDFMLTGVFHDVKSTWGSSMVPFKLTGWAAAGAASVTLCKWAMWYGHIRG